MKFVDLAVQQDTTRSKLDRRPRHDRDWLGDRKRAVHERGNA